MWEAHIGAKNWSVGNERKFLEGSLGPVSDSAHVLGVIETAMDQIDALKENNYIDLDGKEVTLENYEIKFDHVNFGYGMDGSKTAGESSDNRMPRTKKCMRQRKRRDAMSL